MCPENAQITRFADPHLQVSLLFFLRLLWLFYGTTMDHTDFLVLWDSDDDDDDDLVAELFAADRTTFPTRRDVASTPDNEALTDFRFTMQEVRYLRQLLQIGDVFDCGNRLRVPGDEALCILLSRLATTKRKVDIARDFNRSPSVVSTVWNALAVFLRDRWSHVYRFNRERVESKLPEYCAAIAAVGTALENVWEIVDATCREMARPVKNQELFYSGYKHYHNFKFQIVSTPDGLISHVFGPVVGSQNDMGTFHDSTLEDVLLTPPFNTRLIFGDGGYATIGHLCAFIDKESPSDDEAAFNESFRNPRVSVEHAFMRVTQLFGMFLKPSLLRSGIMAVGLFYELAILFTNLRTCLDGRNQITDEFNSVCLPCSCEVLLGLV